MGDVDLAATLRLDTLNEALMHLKYMVFGHVESVCANHALLLVADYWKWLKKYAIPEAKIPFVIDMPLTTVGIEVNVEQREPSGLVVVNLDYNSEPNHRP